MEKQYLLDTNICIYLFKNKYGIKEKLKEIGLSNYFISEITLAELIYGAECSADPKKHTKEIKDLLSIIQVLPIRPILNDFGHTKKELRLKGMMIDNFDLLIGATALSHKMIMVTENVKHLAHIKGLKIENWIQKNI